MAETDSRHDIFDILSEARDPDTNQLAYDEDGLRAELSLFSSSPGVFYPSSCHVSEP